MTETTMRRASAAAAGLGAAVTVYLLSVRASGATLACATGGCETVQHSRYAEIFGLPIAALGLVSFSCLLGAAVMRGAWAALVQATVALAASLFGAYLLYVQLAVLGALCQWCLASDVLVSVIAGLALLRLGPAPTAPKRRRR